MVLLSDGASVDALKGDPVEQSIWCTLGIQTAFPWYETFHGVSDAQGVQRIARKFHIREASVCRFWAEGTWSR